MFAGPLSEIENICTMAAVYSQHYSETYISEFSFSKINDICSWIPIHNCSEDFYTLNFEIFVEVYF